jgi:hypothetical protein
VYAVKIPVQLVLDRVPLEVVRGDQPDGDNAGLLGCPVEQRKGSLVFERRVCQHCPRLSRVQSLGTVIVYPQDAEGTVIERVDVPAEASIDRHLSKDVAAAGTDLGPPFKT